jgi:hypothetical protein
MRLHDAVSVVREPLTVSMPCGAVHRLAGVNTIADEVRATPIRYVLDDAVAVTVAQAAFGDTAQMARCIDLARIPAMSLWIEWSDAGRRRVMQQYGLLDPMDTRLGSGRAGLLVRADDSGRRGFIDVAWDGETGLPDLSPVQLSFDLEDPDFAEVPADDPFLRGLRIQDNAPLCKLFSHVRFSIKDGWRAFYRSACRTDAELAEAVRQNIMVVAADFPYLVGFCLLLSARNALERVPVEMARLNASRAKRGKEPLLDHIEVKAMLHGAGAHDRSETRSTRAHSRLHFVSGHLVRRGAGIFWRRAHVRGNPQRGVISSRTVVVHAGAALH